MSEADARSRIFLTDSKSLVNEDRTDITDEKRVWAVEQERMAGWDVTGSPVLAEVVRNVHPTVLIGLSGQAGLFTKEMIRDVADAVERPLIMPMSNPTNCTEVLPVDALDWTEGRAIVATGSPFDPVMRNGRTHQIGQTGHQMPYPRADAARVNPNEQVLVADFRFVEVPELQGLGETVGVLDNCLHRKSPS